ncbi:secretion protein HlyD [Nitrobacter hamburgensis X14]|uniref:Secretion protein HlyD n=1 Tax=Nitrobacter hamburgensis (strain DSM 10229 / NCIMB 13809 / X14) TaxID=323097 RepID=Q1QQJ2_NITHX|nr:HlyD family secretion protein [Nitrobacter hamburgensis]ABE61505.1 secretion protein HlyD [Nitrobacter hamburgensis X14]
MAEPALKFPSDRKDAPTEAEAPPTPTTVARPRRRLLASIRRYRRPLLLVVLPLIALIAGLTFYLSGGRYVTTDDAYVGAQKVLITPEVSGKIDSVTVKEGQHVKTGDPLFEIDPAPFRFAVQQAQAKLNDATIEYNTLKSNLANYAQSSALAQESINVKQRDVDRKTALAKNNVGSQLDLDNSLSALVQAEGINQILLQQISSTRNKLLGDPDLPLAKFPDYVQARAALADAQRNLANTELRAPIDGIATQVDNIQLGRFVAAGTPVFSVVDLGHPWVDANPKESDFTYVAVGQPVDLSIDSFPDHVFKGTVGSLSPGTGATFAILPPQNATGNFVKVVQRIPVRIYFDKDDPMVARLKSGMSVYVSIDTHHRRTLAGLLGLSRAKQD